VLTQYQRFLQWCQHFQQQAAQGSFDLLGLGQLFSLDLAFECIQQELRGIHASVRYQQCRFQLFVQVVVDLGADEEGGQVG